MLSVLPLAAGANAATILVWGDSLSSAYGLPIESGWVALLGKRLREQGYPQVIVNGSVTGETTAGGASRLHAALLRNKPSIVLIELGGNDGLRGLPLKELRANLHSMVRRARLSGARVLLFEMRIPPNYGATYADGFSKAFADEARAGHAALVPFFLERIATDPQWFQEDGIHPSAAAQPLMLDAVWPVLTMVLPPKAASGGPGKP
jgi:acyl-CoA thioesterase-1